MPSDYAEFAFNEEQCDFSALPSIYLDDLPAYARLIAAFAMPIFCDAHFTHVSALPPL